MVKAVNGNYSKGVQSKAGKQNKTPASSSAPAVAAATAAPAAPAASQPQLYDAKTLENRLGNASLQEQYGAIDTARRGQALLFGQGTYERADGSGSASATGFSADSPIGQAFSAIDKALAAAGLDVDARKGLTNETSRMFFGTDAFDADGNFNAGLFDSGGGSPAAGGFVKDKYDSYTTLKDRLAGYDNNQVGSTYAARGMADVAQTAHAQQQSSLRDALRMGANPSGGKFAAAQQANQPALAAAMAQAANQGRQIAFAEQESLRKETDAAHDKYMTTATSGASALQQALDAQRAANDDLIKKGTAKSNYITDTILG